MLGHGMEHWHPNPDFFFKPGGGPMLDMGPYYITNLINLIGPVKRVAALSGIARKQRVIANAPRKGEKIAVKTPTTIHALLEFATGAQVTLSASWDVFAHRHPNWNSMAPTARCSCRTPTGSAAKFMVAGTDADGEAARHLGASIRRNPTTRSTASTPTTAASDWPTWRQASPQARHPLRHRAHAACRRDHDRHPEVRAKPASS